MKHAALCFGERVAAALVGGYTGCNTGQQRQAFVRSSKIRQHVGSVGFAVRLQQKGCRMSLRCDSANQIIVPFGGIRRQEECRLPACASCRLSRTAAVFSFRRAVIGKIHADRLFRRLFLYLGISMVSLSTGFAGGMIFVLLLRSDPEVLSL